MNVEYARQWISLRLTSTDYKNFVLADLFYDGKVPKDCECMRDVVDVTALTEDDLEELSYNSLRRPIKKKVSYLLSKPFTVQAEEEVKKYIESIVESLKTTANELYRKGEVWWEFEADPTSPLKYKITIRKAQSIVPHYTNEEETEYDSVGYLWNRIDERGQVYRFVDFIDKEGRHRFSTSGETTVEDLGHATTASGQKVVFKSIPFLRLTSDSLYLLVRFLGRSYSEKYYQADSLIRDNVDPVAVVKNASGTDEATLREDIRRIRLVKVDGEGDFSYASISMDYSSLENYMKLLKSDISDQIGVVSREQELNYVTSGRALDRLYVDMDNDAAEMGQILKEALKKFLAFIQEQTGKKFDLEKFDIVFNTDKPTDETSIISNINSSADLLSKETLLAQHPWVEDVQEELRKKEKEKEAEKEQVEEDPFAEEVPEEEEVDKEQEVEEEEEEKE